MWWELLLNWKSNDFTLLYVVQGKNGLHARVIAGLFNHLGSAYYVKVCVRYKVWSENVDQVRSDKAKGAGGGRIDITPCGWSNRELWFIQSCGRSHCWDLLDCMRRVECAATTTQYKRQQTLWKWYQLLEANQQTNMKLVSSFDNLKFAQQFGTRLTKT
jgi:hypothetical protein